MQQSLRTNATNLRVRLPSYVRFVDIVRIADILMVKVERPREGPRA